MKALILAGGRGSRLQDWVKDHNKSMIKLFEKPLIEYNLEHAAEINAKEIVIVVGHKKEEIIEHYGYEFRSIPIKYVVQKDQRGVVHAIECAKSAIKDSDFFLMLADEIVLEAKLKNMLKKFEDEELFCVCGIVHEEDKSSIGKTYNLMLNEAGRIFRLIEKPRFPINNSKGTGHCLFRNSIFDYIERTPINANRGQKELVDMIQCAVDEGKKVYAYKINKSYVNINTKEDFDAAKEMIKKDNPRVLIVHTQMKYLGGAELLIVELANQLTKRGIKNDILALSKSADIERKLINTEIITPKHDINLEPPGFKNMSEILRFIRIYRKELKKLMRNYNIINFHNFPVTWTLFPRKKPCVWMLNEPPNLWSKPRASFMLKALNKLRNFIDRFIVNNSVDVICVADEFNKQRTTERYRKSSRIFYYGINYDFFSEGNAEKATKKLGLKKKFVVVQSGMLTAQKNQLESIKAIEKVKDKIKNIFLVLAGTSDEQYKKKLEDYIKNKKLEKHVLFTGNLSREELRDLYKAANVGLFPVGQQGGWLSPFELICSGNPAIVSEEMGAASIIKKFNLGISTKNYAKALLNVFDNYKDYKEKSHAAAEFVKKNLGWDIFAEKMIKAYKHALKMH